MSGTWLVHRGRAAPGHLADRGRIPEAVERALAAGSWNVPTLSLVEHLAAKTLEAVANVQRRAGVMVGGQWLPEEEIQARLDAVAERVNL